MAGLTTNFTNYEELTGGRSQNVASADLPIPNDPDKWWISSIGDTASATNGGSQYRKFTMSYLFRALYNYNRRYLVNFSFRRDGASVFKYTGNTWDNFYSVGAGWIMSEENFMRNQHVIDYLKIKGSYGVLGNQNVGTEGGNYPAFPTLTTSSPPMRRPIWRRICAGRRPRRGKWASRCRCSTSACTSSRPITARRPKT